MRSYRAEEIGSYGLRSQPEVLRRMRPQQRLVQVGTGLAWLAVLLALLALLLAEDGFGPGSRWPVVALLAAVVSALLCSAQLVVWGFAVQEWSGRRDVDLSAWVLPSRVGHGLCYVVSVAVVCAVGLTFTQDFVPDVQLVLLPVTVVLVLLAQVLAGARPLLTGGAEDVDQLLR